MKNYEEIANAVFKRRDAYIAKQKKERKIVIATVTPMFVCCIALVVGFVLWQGGVFRTNFPTTESSQDAFTESQTTTQDNITDTTTKGSTNKTTNKTTSPETKSSKNPPKTTKNDGNHIVTPPTQDPPSTTIPDVPSGTDDTFVIDSIDKMNFYSAKKIISENSLLPIGMQYPLSSPPTALMSKTYAEYPIDRYQEFTVTMVTYFNIVLHNERGFLAQKLGGTGRVEVVVTQSNIMEDPQLMITFKRKDNYYTCFINHISYNPQTQTMVRCDFSSHKYVDGFNLVKNMEQENYTFTVLYDGAKVMGFTSDTFYGTPSKYAVDQITLVPDFCVVLFTRQTFTIDQLSAYFDNKKEEVLI